MVFLSCSDDSNEKTVLHIAEETDDDLLASTPTTHTTEDLFTIIHRFEHTHTEGLVSYHIISDAFSQKYFWKLVFTAQLVSAITDLCVVSYYNLENVMKKGKKRCIVLFKRFEADRALGSLATATCTVGYCMTGSSLFFPESLSNT